MSFYNKLKWILGILVIFILIIATNLIDRNNFVKVRNSVMTIYEDRLVVKGLIFDMGNIIHQKELAIVKQDSSFYDHEVSQLNEEMDQLIASFEETKLTKQENKFLSDFKENHEQLVNKENKLKSFTRNQIEPLETQVNQLKDDLEQLSNIQLKEGRRQMITVKKPLIR